MSAGILDIIQHTYLRNIFLLELSQLLQAFLLAASTSVQVSGHDSLASRLETCATVTYTQNASDSAIQPVDRVSSTREREIERFAMSTQMTDDR